MTATLPHEENEAPRTGHRPGRNPDEPRNSTVCFMVSETEKAMIDALGMCSNLRRSAILTRIVVTFLDGVAGEEKYETARRELLEFLKECRSAIEEKPDLFREFSIPESERKKKKVG